MKTLKTYKVKAFTLIENSVNQIYQIFQRITILSDVTCTLSISSLTITF